MKRAQERMRARSLDMDLARAVASLHRSEARLKVVQRRRSRPWSLYESVTAIVQHTTGAVCCRALVEVWKFY
jgi:hypothetical protein